MALGGYGPAQYMLLLQDSLKFSPGLIIVGLYLGNDIVDAVDRVYAADVHADLRSSGDAASFPEKDQLWEEQTEISDRFVKEYLLNRSSPKELHRVVSFWLLNKSAMFRYFCSAGWMRFFDPWVHRRTEAAIAWANEFPELGSVYKDGKFSSVLTTNYRLGLLDLSKRRIQEGVRLTQEIIIGMNNITRSEGINFMIALIPTKESACLTIKEKQEKHLKRIEADLLKNESKIREILTEVMIANNVPHIDVTNDLVQGVEAGEMIYRGDDDGYPMPQGYRRIAQSIYKAMKERGW
jgi:hypothetical protein